MGRAMISSEVQRTLVKSPPELWAELSDPASLARHLGELGEIRITRAEPEKLVEWEAEAASGTVAIKASGWGTKVTLTANRELAEASLAVEGPGPDEPSAPSAPQEAGAATAPQEAIEATTPEKAVEATAPQEAVEATAPEDTDEAAVDLQHAADEEPESSPTEPEGQAAEPEAIIPETETETEAPAPRRGFFARLFGRGRRRQASSERPVAQADADSVPAAEPGNADGPAALDSHEDHEPAETPAAEPAHETSPETSAQALSPTPEDSGPALAEPLAAGADEDETTESSEAQLPDLSGELKAAEEAAADEVTAILKGVLDRLGAAHHRPFSRS